MKEKETIIITCLTLLFMILWLGFSFHRSPDFAGSFWGGILAITGSSLMLIPLIYVPIKRIKIIKKYFLNYMKMRTLLTIHIYAGVIGPILAILHTGHKFNSALGISLTGITIIVVLSGFAGRYLLKYLSTEIKEKKVLLEQANQQFKIVQKELQAAQKNSPKTNNYFLWPKLLALSFFKEENNLFSQKTILEIKAYKLSDTIADLEFAITSNNTFKLAFKYWQKIHITIAVFLYILLLLHIWTAIYFGLRWFGK